VIRHTRTAQKLALPLVAVLVLLSTGGQSASAQAQQTYDTPVRVNLASGDSFFTVIESSDGALEAKVLDTEALFGYPEADDCVQAASGQCYTSDGTTELAIGFRGTGAETMAVLLTLTFTPNAGVSLSDAKLSVTTTLNPDPTRELFFNPSNGHYYEYVAEYEDAKTGGNRSFSWFDARDRAEELELTIGGTKYFGYLATVTDLEESTFVGKYVSASSVWFGATDWWEAINDGLELTGGDAFTGQTTGLKPSEGKWYWVTGPKDGRVQFWEGLGSNAGGGPVNDRFHAWQADSADPTKTEEPNDSGGEHFGLLNFTDRSPTSNWNDYPDGFAEGGFLAEFGPIDSDFVKTLSIETEFSIPELLARPAAVSRLALECTPDPVVPGALVTCEITRGDPGIDILWEASFNPVVASTGVTLDENGYGKFTFVAPMAARGQSIAVDLVGWGVSDSVLVTGDAIPNRLPAGGGPSGPAPGVLVAGLMLATGLGVARLRRGVVSV
jgi:hypothetical protein